MNIYFYDNRIFFPRKGFGIFFFALRVLILRTGEVTMI